MENEQSAMQQSYLYETANVRLQCLQLAARAVDTDPASVVAAAQKFYDFVLGGAAKA